MAPPTRAAMNSNESMQKLMLLTSQQEALRRRVSLSIPVAAPMTASSPAFQSLSSSPTPSVDYSSTYPMATDPIPAQPGIDMGHRNSIDDLHSEDAQKLAEVNQQIKATLTELLNTESARSDEKYRAWIQERLMGAEHEIRRQRRRRSSGVHSDREFASHIAHQLELGLHTSRTWG